MKKSPNPVDKHVGSRVRMRRLMLDMSQEKLGSALGLTFQQVQKYVNSRKVQYVTIKLSRPLVGTSSVGAE